MAWHSITWSCNHTSDKQLYGSRAERDNYINWAMRTGLCPTCYGIQQDQRRKAVIEQDHLKAQESAGRLQDEGMILPALQGSDKQISWAKDIRAKLYDSPIGWAVNIIAERNPKNAATARWWIDRRSRGALDWARLAFDGDWGIDWTEATPDCSAAWQILRNHPAIQGNTMAEIIQHLSGLAAMPLVGRPAYKTVQYGWSSPPEPATEWRTAIDAWLVHSWSRHGLIDWLKVRMETKAASIESTAAVATKVDQMRAQTQAAEQRLIELQQAKAQAEIAASKVQADLDQAEANVAIASRILGARGLIDNQLMEVIEVRDEGMTLIVRVAGGDDTMELSGVAWFRAYERYMSQKIDSEVTQ